MKSPPNVPGASPTFHCLADSTRTVQLNICQFRTVPNGSASDGRATRDVGARVSARLKVQEALRSRQSCVQVALRSAGSQKEKRSAG